MQFLVLERVGEMTLRDMPMERDEVMGPHDLRIALHTVGICGSGVHYLTHGRIGPFPAAGPDDPGA
jgi:D-xylulose reductase